MVAVVVVVVVVVVGAAAAVAVVVVAVAVAVGEEEGIPFGGERERTAHNHICRTFCSILDIDGSSCGCFFLSSFIV